MFLLVKLLANHASTFQLLFYRGLIQVVLSLLTIRYYEDEKNPLGPPGAVRLWLLLRATLGAAAVCAWFWGCQVLPLPDAITLQFTSPAFAAAFAVCMVGEPWLPRDVIGAVVCLTGVAFIAHPTWLFGNYDESITDEEDGNVVQTDLLIQALGAVVTTAGSALAGLAYVCVRVIGDRASAVVMVCYYGAVSMPVAVIGSIFFEGNWDVLSISGGDTLVRDSVLILLVGILGYTAQWLLNLGLQIETAAVATLATTTQLIWSYIFELAFLHEALNRWSLGGSGMILAYMVVVAIIKFIPDQPTEEQERVVSEETPLLVASEEGQKMSGG